MDTPYPDARNLIQIGMSESVNRRAKRENVRGRVGARERIHRVTLCSATLGEDGKSEPPLGPLYIASIFEQCGVEVDFRDYQLDEAADSFSGKHLAQFLNDHQEMVAISCFVDMLPAVIDATRRLAASRPETIFLLGGPGPTASARRILEEYPWINGVIRGEGEETLADWIQLLRGTRSGPIQGMIYRDGLNLIDGGNRARNHELDDLPLPAYHLIDWANYSHARVITTRGCSYRCSFCDVTALWGNRSVYRGLENTIAEMEMLRDHCGKSSIAIVDDTFVLNRDRVRSFCRMLIERRAGIKWGCFGRINLMTPDLVELMAEAGCCAVFYGIDSGSPEILEKTVKRVKAKDILPVLRLSARYFSTIEASFIWGYPFESLDDFRRTFDIAAEAASLAPVVNVQLHMLSPLPLSPIYKEFPNKLKEPEAEDLPWLLLPALLLDQNAKELARLVRAAPDIYPGFYCFETPAKKSKRKLLQRSMAVLDQTIGSTLFDPRRERLLREPDAAVERELLRAYKHPADRIGMGLAVALFSRLRHRRNEHSDEQMPFAGTRGARMVRERSEPAGSHP